MNDKITFVNCRVRNTKKCNKCYVKAIQSWLAHTPSFSRDLMTVNGEYKKKAKKKRKKEQSFVTNDLDFMKKTLKCLRPKTKPY